MFRSGTARLTKKQAQKGLKWSMVSQSALKRATPGRAELVRGHWRLKHHWVRDVTFDEDRSQVRLRTSASDGGTRNTAIGL